MSSTVQNHPPHPTSSRAASLPELEAALPRLRPLDRLVLRVCLAWLSRVDLDLDLEVDRDRVARIRALRAAELCREQPAEHLRLLSRLR